MTLEVLISVVLTNAGTKAAMDEMQYGEMF